ncbi:transmembrane 9 superfamily member 4-like isoform X2 [Fagus crenata]
MAGRVRTSFLALLLIALPVLAFAIRTLRPAPLKEARQYEQGDHIPLYANKVHSHQCKAYSYFDLPFCPPGGNEVKRIKISAEMNQDFIVDISEDTEIKVNFTYSVIWRELALNQSSVFEHTEEIGGWADWLICICFGLLCAVIVLYLRNYFTRNSPWINLPPQIHGDACSCPRYSSLLGAILGVGLEQFIIICFLFGLAYEGRLYSCNHELYTLLVMINCLTSFISGYMAVQFHSGFTPNRWGECIIQTEALFSVPVFLTGLAINVLAGSHLPKYYSAATILFIRFEQVAATIEILLLSGCIRFLLILLLLLLAGWFAYDSVPITCATTYFQNQRILNQPWYMKTPAQMFLGGLLPFIFIFWWMDDIYASLYHLKVCGAFWTLFGASISVIAVTVMVGMASTYYQLSRQDNHWWWRSVFRGGSTAIFMFAYGLYFHARANTQNFMSLPIFLGYNACIFYAVFLILGTIGFYVSSIVFYHEDRRRKRLANPLGEKKSS